MAVLRELREVLKEARQPPGKDPVATFDAVSSNYPAGGENAVRRFEREETSPRYEDVDRMVAAYSTATGVSVLDLWKEAIDRAQAAEAKLKQELGSRSQVEAGHAASSKAASKRALQKEKAKRGSPKDRRRSG